MSIFDQDMQINHEILIENGWEKRSFYANKSKPKVYVYVLKIAVKPLKKIKWFSPEVWFEYNPMTKTIDFLDSYEIKSQKVDTISDINIYINLILNQFDYIRI